jgi:hypothetical protein
MKERSRCIICGELIRNGVKQFCDWCQDPKIEEILKKLVDDVDSLLQQANRIDVQTNPMFSLIADLGILGLRHPLLASFSKVIAILINEGGKGVRRFKISTLRHGQKDIKTFIMMLHDFGLVIYDDMKDEITVPDQSLLLKIKHELEVEPRRNPVAAFALGYVTLKSILKTLELAKQRRVEYGEGVTGLYSVTKDMTGKLKFIMPKSYMTTLAFVLGYWAKGVIEFSELDIHRFMVDRGITGKEFSEVLATLSCAFATTHALYERVSVEHIGRYPIHRFKLNEEYAKLYERIRMRGRI